jgi:hypothetical protein
VSSCAKIDEEAVLVTGFDEARVADIPLRDGLTQHDRACLLAWDSSSRLTLDVPPSMSDQVDGSLVLAMVNSLDATAPADPHVVVTDHHGTVASLRLSDLAPPRPLVPVALWKAVGLDERYAPTEKMRWPAERFPQTYALPLAAFVAVEPTLDLRHLATVAIEFDQPGSVFLDDIGFEPPAGIPSAH